MTIFDHLDNFDKRGADVPLGIWPPFFQNCALCRKACLPLYIGKQIWNCQPLTILGLYYAFIYLRFSLNGHSRARALTYCFFAWYMYCKFRIFNVLLHTVYDLFLCTASSMKCPISTYIFNCHILPQLLAAYIQSKYIFLKMYTPQPCARRAHRNPPTYIHPPSVGMIYPISTYIFN